MQIYITPSPSGGGGLPIMAYNTGRLRPKGVLFAGFTFVTISLAEVYEKVGKSVISCKR